MRPQHSEEGPTMQRASDPKQAERHSWLAMRGATWQQQFQAARRIQMQRLFGCQDAKTHTALCRHASLAEQHTRCNGDASSPAANAHNRSFSMQDSSRMQGHMVSLDRSGPSNSEASAPVLEAVEDEFEAQVPSRLSPEDLPENQIQSPKKAQTDSTEERTCTDNSRDSNSATDHSARDCNSSRSLDCSWTSLSSRHCPGDRFLSAVAPKWPSPKEVGPGTLRGLEMQRAHLGSHKEPKRHADISRARAKMPKSRSYSVEARGLGAPLDRDEHSGSVFRGEPCNQESQEKGEAWRQTGGKLLAERHELFGFQARECLTGSGTRSPSFAVREDGSWQHQHSKALSFEIQKLLGSRGSTPNTSRRFDETVVTNSTCLPENSS